MEGHPDRVRDQRIERVVALGEEGRLRVTYGTRQENDRFLAALDDLL